jgi:hypothetical protein
MNKLSNAATESPIRTSKSCITQQLSVLCFVGCICLIPNPYTGVLCEGTVMMRAKASCVSPRQINQSDFQINKNNPGQVRTGSSFTCHKMLLSAALSSARKRCSCIGRHRIGRHPQTSIICSESCNCSVVCRWSTGNCHIDQHVFCSSVQLNSTKHQTLQCVSGQKSIFSGARFASMCIVPFHTVAKLICNSCPFVISMLLIGTLAFIKLCFLLYVCLICQ